MKIAGKLGRVAVYTMSTTVYYGGILLAATRIEILLPVVSLLFRLISLNIHYA